STIIGQIVGGAVDGTISLLIIFGIMFLIYRNMQNKHQQVIEGTTGRLSVFSGGGGSHNETDPSKFEVGTTPMVGPSGGPGSGGVTPGVSASPPPAANHGTGSATGSHTPPPFNPYVIPTLAPRMMSMNPDADQQTDVMSELRSPHNPYG
ncbi:hypothetical protein FRB97_004518, partial [Tulasnella sp. 331]